MRLVLVICIAIIQGPIVAQSGLNPFDLQHRLDSIYTSTPEASKETNVFDIDRSGEGSLDNTDISNPLIEDQEVDATTAQVEPTPQQPSEKADIAVSDDNPFEVSHIPLRKSKLKQEANAFSTKKVQTRNGDTNSSNTFIFWLTLLSGIFVAFVINTKAHVIPRLVKSITNTNVLTYNMREENGGLSGQYIILYITYFINAAVLVYLLIQKYGGPQGFNIFTYCLLGVTSMYAIKHIVLAALGFTFPIGKEMGVYNFSIEVFNILLGLVLIPLNLVIAFGPTQLSQPFIYLALGLVVILLIIRSVRALFVATPYLQRNFFQFFIYLCGIEIVPILLLLKVAQ